MRQEMVKTKAKKQGPVNSALREQIEQLFKADQAVRERNEFNLEKKHGHAGAVYLDSIPCGRAGPVGKAVLKSSWNLVSSLSLFLKTFTTCTL